MPQHAGMPRVIHMQPETTQGVTATRYALTVNEAIFATTMSRNTLYRLMARGELKTVKVGSRRLIPVTEVQRILAVAS